VSSGLTIINNDFFSCQPILGVTELPLLDTDNFSSRLLVYIINQYIILVWDPGILYFCNFLSRHLPQILYTLYAIIFVYY